MGGAASIAGQAVSAVGGERARKGAKRGASQAAGEFKGIPGFQFGGGGWENFATKDAPLWQNIGSLLSNNGLGELQPALQANARNTQNQQTSFAEQLGRSGLGGSGFGLGGNQAIANQGGVNASNILSQLPDLQRKNLGAVFPFFASMMEDIARRQGGRAKIKSESALTNAAGKANSSSTMGNMIGGMGDKGSKGGMGAVPSGYTGSAGNVGPGFFGG